MITAAVIRLYSLRAMVTRGWRGLGLAAVVLVVTAASPAAGLEPRAARLDGDRAAVLQYRAGLRDVVAAVRAHPDLVSAGGAVPPALPDARTRAEVRSLWARFLDYLLALDAIGRQYQRFDELHGPAQSLATLIGHAVFVAEYRFALDLLDRLDHVPALHVVLNEPVSELGLPRDTYARVRARFLNVLRGSEFAAWTLVGEGPASGVAASLGAAVAEDRAEIGRAGRGRGPVMTLTNAIRIVQRTGAGAWFPVQAGVAEWMGDTRLGQPRPALVAPAQIATLPARLEAGDVLLERREWYLSNIGLPGFWPHSALYIGQPEDRRALAQRTDVQAWVREQGEPGGDLEALLRARHPAAYARSLVLEDGHPRRVLEAMSEGVVFTSLEHSAAADSVAVLRPRLGPVEKAAALVRAFGYAGRPYDFDFDFRSDAALVCTELIYKAYERAPGQAGLGLPVPVVAGRPVLPANDVARHFDETYGSERQVFDFVLFLDGRERAGVAVERPVGEFRRSWQRPKWRLRPDG
jgi:hypothetical protein